MRSLRRSGSFGFERRCSIAASISVQLSAPTESRRHGKSLGILPGRGDERDAARERFETHESWGCPSSRVLLAGDVNCEASLRIDAAAHQDLEIAAVFNARLLRRRVHPRDSERRRFEGSCSAGVRQASADTGGSLQSARRPPSFRSIRNRVSRGVLGTWMEDADIGGFVECPGTMDVEAFPVDVRSSFAKGKHAVETMDAKRSICSGEEEAR